MGLNVEKHPIVSKRPNWFLYCTGGVLTSGGLAWWLRLSCAEQPKAAMSSLLAGTAGVCLFSMTLSELPGKKASKIPTSKWLMLTTGGILTASGFGYCLTLTLMESPKSTIAAYLLASLGYSMAYYVLFTMSGSDGRMKYPYGRLSNKEIAEIVNAANARIHYIGNTDSCEFCKSYVEKRIRERKEAEKAKQLKELQSKGLDAKVKTSGFLQNMWNFLFRAKNKATLVAEKTSRGGLKREMSKACGGNIGKEQSDRKETKKSSGKCKDKSTSKKQLSENDRKQGLSGISAEIVVINVPDRKTSIKPTTVPRPMKLSRDPMSTPQYVHNMPGNRMTVPNKFPGEKSTQTQSQRILMGTQTEESSLVCVNETAKEDPSTTESQSEVDECALEERKVASSVLVKQSRRRDLLRVSSEDQYLEHKQRSVF